MKNLKKIIILVLVMAVGGIVYMKLSKNKAQVINPVSNSLSFIHYNEKQTQEAMAKGIPLVDIRRKDEWQEFGIIEGAYKMTFFDKQGKYDISKWLNKFNKIIKTKDQEFILVCAHANRTKVVGQFLEQEGYTKIRELSGGIMNGWINKGLKTVTY